MNVTIKQDWKNNNRVLKSTAPSAKADRTSFSKRVTMILLMGMVVLLPINIINLPLNMTFADYWILISMPVLWLFLIRQRPFISLSYAVAIWIILVSVS